VADVIWQLIIGGLWKPLAGLAALLVAWIAGRRGAAVRTENKGLRDYQKTRERMDDAEDNLADDPATLRDWLRERGKQ